MAKRNEDDEAPEVEPAPALSARPNDIPIEPPRPAPLGGNTTFAQRAKAANKRVAPERSDSK